MRAEVDVAGRERRRARSRRGALASIRWRALAAWAFGTLLAVALAVGVLFAGSPSRIPAGVTAAGANVAGLTAEQATIKLEKRAARVASVPVTLTADGERFQLRPTELDARVDWAAAAAAARDEGDWPLPFRGLKRVAVRLFGADVQPVAEVYEPRLEFELERMARALDRRGRNASIVLRGLEPSIVRHREGRMLDRPAAAALVRRALARFERTPLALPVEIGPPGVTTEDLKPVLERVRLALSAPVRFGWRDAHWSVEPEELAELLLLPANGRAELGVGGQAAERYFGVLARAVNRRPREAEFAIRPNGRVRVVPSATGRKLDVDASAKALLAGALSSERREAELVVVTAEPRLNTAHARGMKITHVLASYTTPYSGTSDRIRNLELAAAAIDGTTLAPGEDFSFNRVVGPRTRARGYRLAPTIIDGEYKDAPGGGVSQVATTVFNAAWEAGLKLTARTPHSLYIPRYELGRDATVNYPNVDLRFENETERWLVVRAQAGGEGITVSILGAPLGRRVVSVPGELRVTAPPDVETVPDPTLHEGERVVEDDGEPARAVSVKRVVYEGGEVLYSETWYTSYQSEPRIVRVGTIPVPEAPPPTPPAPSAPSAPPAQPPAPPTTSTPTTTGAPPATGASTTTP
jgi:vancomycin resistance protein YoaR